MTLRIEDYGLIGDMHTAALVGIDGSIDWLCLPRFNSSACFAHLLGTEENGRWRIAPAGNVVAATRRYRPSTLVLETDFETADGVARIIDCMALRVSHPRYVRVVEGVRGTVPMSRSAQPAVRLRQDRAVDQRQGEGGERRGGARGAGAAGRRTDHDTGAPVRSRVRPCAQGERTCFVLTWHLSWEPAPPPIDAIDATAETDAWWRAWSGRSTYKGKWKDEVERSLITLKALTYAPTGGIVAAVTTSLPEFLGGVRNWDYRGMLAPGRGACARGTHGGWIRGGGDQMARLGDPRRRRRPGGPADHVRGRRRALARPLRAELAAGLRGVRPSAGRERCLGSAAARRVWRVG